MKKLFSLLLFSMILTSCTRGISVDEAIIEKADDISEIPAVTDKEEYMGDFLPETEYSAGDLTQTDGILYGSGFRDALADGKYYFDVCRSQKIYHPNTGDYSQGSTTLPMSINLDTGEAFSLCPDPLCEHIDGICPYVNLNCIGYYNGRLYFLRFSYYSEMTADGPKDYIENTIEQLDPASGVFRTIITHREYFTSNPEENLQSAFIHNGRLYYTVSSTFTDQETRSQTQTKTLFTADAESGEIINEQTVPGELTDEGWSVSFMDENYYYGLAASSLGMIRTDHNFENRVNILENEDYPLYGGMQTDTNTGESFVYLRRTLEGTVSAYNGILCRINGDGYEILDMPHENITSFQITRDSIYYTAYDPVDLGAGRRGRYIVEDGGRLYRTDRETRTECELIFDDGVNFDWSNVTDKWLVLGDNLYFGSALRVEENGTVYHSPARSLKYVRVNLVNHTARYFRFK